MKKRIFGIVVCVILVSIAITMTACNGERDALRELVDTLEGENADMQSTITSLRTELESTKIELSVTQNQLQGILSELEAAAAAEEQSTQQSTQSGPLAITYGGQPNTDMSWPISYGILDLGLHVNWNEFDDDLEIEWESGNENVFTVFPGADGMTARVTPVHTGSAQMIVRLGNEETRSWIRIT